MALKVYNTLTKQKEEFIPLEPGKVGMYVCGMTVYDLCHLGHARLMLTFDVIVSYLEYKGFKVRFVRNFTDVDDKIIQRAQAEGVSPKEIAERYIQEFYRDMNALGIRRASVEPRATEHIPEMIALIQGLIEKGLAYKVNGDVYFEVEKFKNYGKLSGRKLEDMLSGARVEIDERKRSPLDFVLWKSSKPGEPFWESPWGKGRPGWHIECSAMSMKYLGETFDIHGGGQDLIFPHHENEIAQSTGYTGKLFARYWLHNGFVTIHREKMSKSLGNFFTVREILKKYKPEAVKFFLLSTHYRSPIDFSEDRLEEATRALERFYNTFNDVAALQTLAKKRRLAPESERKSAPGGSEELEAELKNLNTQSSNLKRDFEAAMDDDFNTADALGYLFEMIKQVNVVITRVRAEERYEETALAPLVEAISVIKSLGRILGLFSQEGEGVSRQDISPRAEDKDLVNKLIEILIEIRKQARRDKNWKLADQIRDQLAQLDIILKDHPGGETSWEKKIS